jgi:endogenous inhibitor of DNA gyrase (YacG/DUF329 family)
MAEEKQETKKTVRCPICGKQVPFDDPNMPFCSDRCRVIDLGNWASEKYVIPGARKDIEDDFGENE